MKKRLVCFIVSVVCSMAAYSTDYLFSAVSPSGHTIYYRWNYDDIDRTKQYPTYNSMMVVCNSVTVQTEYSTELLGDTTLHGAVVIPDSVTYGSKTYAVTRIKAFWAPYITDLTIPESVKTIDMDALDMCGFASLTIPEGVTSVGCSIALNCPNLTSVYYNARNAKVKSGCGALFSWTIREVVVGESVEYIPECFCDNRDSLRYVTILGHVKRIGERAFRHCDSLRIVSITGSVDTIGEATVVK